MGRSLEGEQGRGGGWREEGEGGGWMIDRELAPFLVSSTVFLFGFGRFSIQLV